MLGDYHYDCPLDNVLFTFKGITSAQFKTAVQGSKTYEDVGAWLLANGTSKTSAEIKTWSDEVEAGSPMKNPERRDSFISNCSKLGLIPETSSTFDWLEEDDRASFGKISLKALKANAASTGKEEDLKMYKTGNDISQSQRLEINAILNQRLASAVDLQMQMKQAHWNVKGPNFIGLHELSSEALRKAPFASRLPVPNSTNTHSRLRKARHISARSSLPFRPLGMRRGVPSPRRMTWTTPTPPICLPRFRGESISGSGLSRLTVRPLSNQPPNYENRPSKRRGLNHQFYWCRDSDRKDGSGKSR
jgi:hypothetical protein